AAAGFGEGWEAYLQGLLAVLHFVDHAEDNLRDLQGVLGSTVAVAAATRRVNAAGVQRIVQAGNELRSALGKLFQQASEVMLDETLLRRLEVASWQEVLGELKLPFVDAANVTEWMNAVDSWVNHAAGACGVLRTHALELLLQSEASLAEHLRRGTRPDAVPAASRVPAGYDTLLLGAERKRDTQLGWWVRFQIADGIVPAVAR